MTQEAVRRLRQVTAALVTTHTEVRLVAALSAGSNKVRLTAVGASSPYLDQLAVD